MKQVFLDIQRLLGTLSALRYVGEDWGQLNFEQPPVQFPCALIDLGNVQFSQAGRNTQLGEATLHITLADMRYSGISPAAPMSANDQSFEIFDLIEQVNVLLHGHAGQTYGSLMRLSLKKVMRPDSVREFLMTYKFNYKVINTAPIITKNPVPPEIAIDVQK